MTEDTATKEQTPAKEPQPAPELPQEIAAQSAAPETLELVVAPVRTRSRVAWWPFAAYIVLWVGLIAVTVYLLAYGSQAELPAVSQDVYGLLLLAGLIMTILGPLVAMIAWFVVWLRCEKGARNGLFTIAFVRGSILTFAGVILWYGALVAVDAVRLGLITLPDSLS